MIPPARLRRVVLDGLPLQVRSAGIAVYTEHLVRALAQERPDLDITLIGLSRLARLALRATPAGQERAPWPARVRWIESARYLAAMGYPTRWASRLLPLEAVTGPADVFHATNYAGPRRRAARLVVTIHDLALLRFPELGTEPLRAHVEQACAALPGADRIIADSQCTARDVVELTGADAARVRVVYPGCNPRCVPQNPDAARARVAHRFGLDGPYLLHVGTWEPRKNLPTLLRAFAALPTPSSAAHRLALVGRRGWNYEPILAAIGDLGLGDRVRVIEDAADDELPALYAAAELFVYPSLYEGFGLPVVEAMACGTPVVASKTPAVAEVGGDAVMLIDPNDPIELAAAMDRALTDGDLRAALATRGFRRAAEFSWSRCARETLAVYEEALASAPRMP